MKKWVDCVSASYQSSEDTESQSRDEVDNEH